MSIEWSVCKKKSSDVIFGAVIRYIVRRAKPNAL